MNLLARRRALMGTKSKPIMNPSFGYTDGYVLEHTVTKPYLNAKNGFAVSDFIYRGELGNVNIFMPSSAKSLPSSKIGEVMSYDTADVNSNYTEWWALYQNNGTKTISTNKANRKYIRISFDPDTMADMYAYNSTTGYILYAGINTPYYGKTNIND